MAATRKLYGAGNFTRVRAPHLVKSATGTRDNQRQAKLRSVQAGGKFSQPLSADELVELLLATVQGGVTGTQEGTTGHYTWTFAPTATLDSQTWEWFDGYRNWQQRGVLVDQLKLTGDVKADAMVEATLFGRELAQVAGTTGLTVRTPSLVEGWEAQVYIDNIGATPGTTNIPGTLTKWDLTVSNKATRKYFADNTTATGAVVLGELDIKATFNLEGDAAAFTEYGNWDAVTERLVQLKLGNNGANIGTSTTKPQVKINMPGAWAAVDLTPEEDGTKVYKFSFEYVYDVVNLYGIEFVLENARAAAY